MNENDGIFSAPGTTGSASIFDEPVSENENVDTTDAVAEEAAATAAAVVAQTAGPAATVGFFSKVCAWVRAHPYLAGGIAATGAYLWLRR